MKCIVQICTYKGVKEKILVGVQILRVFCKKGMVEMIGYGQWKFLHDLYLIDKKSAVYEWHKRLHFAKTFNLFFPLSQTHSDIIIVTTEYHRIIEMNLLKMSFTYWIDNLLKLYQKYKHENVFCDITMQYFLWYSLRKKLFLL